MADPLAARRSEQAQLIEVAREYVRRASARIPVIAAAVVGSVARGDFNVWSDIDVVLVAEELPERAPDRQGLLLEPSTPGIQPVGFTRAEFQAALRKGNRLAREAVGVGVPLVGERFFAESKRLVFGAR